MSNLNEKLGEPPYDSVDWIIQALEHSGYEPLPENNWVALYQWLKKLAETPEEDKHAFFKSKGTTILWDCSGKAKYALELMADDFFGALQDVLGLHCASSEPDNYETIGCVACGYNSEYGQYLQKFPCPTYQDIYNRIREVM